MAGNFRELQAKMDSASRRDNVQRVREELQRMALEELRGAKQLTQSDMAEMPLSTKPVKASGLTKAMRALHLPEVQIASLKAWLEKGAGRTEIAGGGPGIDRVFSVQDLVAAGFDETNTDQT